MAEGQRGTGIDRMIGMKGRIKRGRNERRTRVGCRV